MRRCTADPAQHWSPASDRRGATGGGAELAAGIGVGYGAAVAGNVGAIERFEFTVIGDPVNESARLSELAKRDPRRPLASQVAVAAANPDEAVHWETQDAEVLRGRSEATVVCAAIV